MVSDVHRFNEAEASLPRMPKEEDIARTNEYLLQ